MKLPFVSSIAAEPKSVLDIRRSPPSPVTGTSSELTSFAYDSFEHGMINNQVDEWDSDSLMRELGLYDDSNTNSNSNTNNSNNNSNRSSGYPLDLPDLPSFFYSDFDQNLNQNLFDLNNLMSEEDATHTNEFDYRIELTRLAECFETQSFQLAQVILSRLNQRLRSPTGKPLQRAAFYFKEAIQNLFNGSTSTTRSLQSCTSYEIVQVIKAYRTFSTVSPIPMFSSFTANQAILDAVDGVMIVHVIDFDIGFGGHWASFLKAVAEKAEARKVHSPAVRITAVVPEEYEPESRLIRDNLHQFSTDLKLRFEINFVSIRAFEFASFKSIKFINGEKTAVLLSPMIFRRIGSGFVNDLRRVSPTVVVYVDGELNGSGASFFSKAVIDGVELYTTVLESLEAANVAGGAGGDWIKSIEMFVLLPKIIAAVEDGGRNVSPWREAFGRAGLRPVAMSQFGEFQAECLVRRVQVRGFHVVKQHAEMMLCWHDRPLVATSVWSF
ncbi:putative transcription factor GRAS family [Helianthus annuus]|uniref:Putative transcription factor GRAS n=1 Tax=Helianthus annuus TaxID=4232 RepID=A0A251T8T2_HELAN|nr:scarecrow-like protein 15 isoform X3 [Helianthus annuus]KAJ0507533.1 putative transcription factor GRAS family [Helianthus annuus]